MMPKSIAPSDSRLAEISGVVHQDEGHHHGERNGDADDQRAARAAEEQDEHDEHEADALRRPCATTLSIGGVDQVGAVEIGHDLHVVGLQPLVELGDLGVDAVEDARGIFAAQQQHDALDDVVPVVLAEDAVALLVAELQLAEIAHEDRRAVALGDDDVAEIVERLHQADAADDVAELAAREDAAAGIGAVGVDRVGDVLERQVEPHELLRIELELELGREAAEVRDVGDARHLLERRDHDPALDLRELAQILGVGFQRVVENLAGRRGQRIEAGREARRQRDVLDALHDALARPVVLDAVAEHERDQRQPERAARAHHRQARRAVELALERNGDLLLDLLGGEARRLGDDLRGGVGDVRIGLDRELGPRIVAVDGGEDADHRHDQALAQREADEPVNH